MVLIDVTEGLGQEEGAAGLAERLSDWRARGVSGEDADAAASALLSQASQIEALRKERDEAREERSEQAEIAANTRGVHVDRNKWKARAEAAETKLAEAILHIEQLAELLSIIKEHWIDYDHVFSISVDEARKFLDANGGGQ